MAASELLQHPFITMSKASDGEESQLSNLTIAEEEGIASNISHFMRARKFETTVLSSFAALLAPKEKLSKIMSQFLKIDKNKDG